jgi:hypothetical protein
MVLMPDLLENMTVIADVDQARFLKVTDQTDNDVKNEQENDDVEEGSHAENDAGNNVSFDDGDDGDENALPAVQRIREAAAHLTSEIEEEPIKSISIRGNSLFLFLIDNLTGFDVGLTRLGITK